MTDAADPYDDSQESIDLGLSAILYYAQRGVRERLSDTIAAKRHGSPVDRELLLDVIEDAEAIARMSGNAGIELQPALARMLDRAKREVE